MSGALAGALFGDGSDGTVTFDGVATILGMVPVANVYTMTRDLYLDTATINTGITLNTGGFRIFVKTLLTLTGFARINYDGLAGSAGLVNGGGGGAAALAAGTLGGSNAGGAGGNPGGGSGVSVAQGTNATDWRPGLGGAGGAGVGAGGGNGGFSLSASANGSVNNFLAATVYNLIVSGAVASLKLTGGGGGGGGGGGNNAPTGGFGGGGGSGGGLIVVVARQIAGTGSITARGGAGGAGFAGGGGLACGGGGGGGGGLITVAIGQGAFPTTDVSGGLGGAGGNGGVAGVAGSAGKVVFLGP